MTITPAWVSVASEGLFSLLPLLGLSLFANHQPSTAKALPRAGALVLWEPRTATVPALHQKAGWSSSWELLGIPEFGVCGVRAAW